jgi:hypothetical protein
VGNAISSAFCRICSHVLLSNAHALFQAASGIILEVLAIHSFIISTHFHTAIHTSCLNHLGNHIHLYNADSTRFLASSSGNHNCFHISAHFSIKGKINCESFSSIGFGIKGLTRDVPTCHAHNATSCNHLQNFCIHSD